MKTGWDEKEFQTDCRDRAEAFLKQHAKNWIFQLERGEETGRLHYQIYCRLHKKKTVGGMISLVHTELECAEVSIASTNGIEALKNYSLKDATKVNGPWMDKVQQEKDSESKKLFRQNCEFDMEEEYRDIEEHPRAFQNQLRAKCDPSETNRRHIIWVGSHDGSNGNIGKTHWANYMADKFGAEFHTYGNATDIANVICNSPKSRLYIFNLPRSKPKDSTLVELFNIMEQLKDGRVRNYKYQGGVLKMRKPHVVVFANYFPTKLEALGMSADRWKFYEVSPAPNYKLVPTQPRVKLTNDHDESTSRAPMCRE